MSRPRKGSVYWDETRRCYVARITCNDGSRVNIPLEPSPKSPQAEARARERAAAKSEEFARRGIVANPQRHTSGNVERAEAAKEAEGGTFAVWFERWCKDREARGTPARDQRGHFAKWIGPRFVDRLVDSITRRDVESWVEWIDGQVRAGALSAKTAANVWGTFTKAMRDAAAAKTLGLRVLPESPARDVEGPDAGVRKSKTYLYPAELLAVMTCERVPIRWRRLLALGAYLYLRTGELEALEWEDVDLARRRVHVHRAIDRTDGTVKSTKTDTPRRVPIEPTIVPLLELLKREAKGPRVFAMPPACDLAPRVRQYLRWAGVTRAELFADDATRKQIGFYDATRATGITWMAVRGDDPLKVKQRAGHAAFSTTERYIREAENLDRDAFGEPFPTLPASLLQSADELAEGPARWAQLRESTYESIASPAGFETEQSRDVAAFRGECAEVAPEDGRRHARNSANPGSPLPIAAETIAAAETPTRPGVDVVEAALADALRKAADASQWQVVAQLGRELEARREAAQRATTTNVVSLDTARSRRS